MTQFNLSVPVKAPVLAEQQQDFSTTPKARQAATGCFLPTGTSAQTNQQDFFSIAELAIRWHCSRGTVYNRLRSTRTKVLDFAPRGKKGKKLVSVSAVFQLEAQKSKPLC
jgi:hypothetical protein